MVRPASLVEFTVGVGESLAELLHVEDVVGLDGDEPAAVVVEVHEQKFGPFVTVRKVVEKGAAVRDPGPRRRRRLAGTSCD